MAFGAFLGAHVFFPILRTFCSGLFANWFSSTPECFSMEYDRECSCDYAAEVDKTKLILSLTGGENDSQGPTWHV